MADDILSYWDRKAEVLRTDPSATMKDVLLRSLEIEAIRGCLRADDDLLDVGTGNAFAAVEWSRTCRSVLGVDNSRGMLEAARESIAASGRTNVAVQEADILDLAPFSGRFSATSCVRCLINLRTEEEQLSALRQLASTLRSGGRLFLIEGLEETFQEMNTVRGRSGLAPIPLNWHNRLLRRDRLQEALAASFRVVETVDFGEYYFLSRIVHPRLVSPEEPRFTGRLNEVACEVWRSGVVRGRFADISTLVLYVAERL